MSKPSKKNLRKSQARVNSANLTDYHHRQAARALLTLISFPLMVCALAAWSHPVHRTSLIIVCVLLIIAASVFSSLRLTVTHTELSWRFGAGLIHKHVPLIDIASAEITRSTWLEGWGIHYTRRGWLYNVSGRDAVLITQKNGKQFLLGSDDVVGLWEALQNRITPT